MEEILCAEAIRSHAEWITGNQSVILDMDAEVFQISILPEVDATLDLEVATICGATVFTVNLLAWICAVVITAGLLRCGAKAGRQSPVFITAEGSTFYKLKGFREKLHICMDELAGRDHGLHFEFHNVPDVILKGIAVACLSD